MGWIEGDRLEDLLPHRGVNLLIDAVRVTGSGDSARGESRVRIARGDARGRDIFLRESADGGLVWIEPALAEHVALSAICIMRPDMSPGELAFFSVISRFALARELREGEEARAEVRRLRDKGRFRRFEGTILGEDGDTVASSAITAYAAGPAAARGGEDRRDSGKLLAPPRVSDVRPVERGHFTWKRPAMVFVDDRVDLVATESADGADAGEATLRYTYPADHPFCEGHFPGKAVMMGVTQWIAAADAAAWLLVERGQEKGSAGGEEPRWKADADIIRESGSLVAEVRGLLLALGGGSASRPVTPGPSGCALDARPVTPGPSGCALDARPVTPGPSRCALDARPYRVDATRRVGFRGQVRPGETVFVRVRVRPAEEAA